MTVLDKYIASVKERAEKVRPGPWKKVFAGDHGTDVVTATGREYRKWYGDADFISHARTDIDRLVKMVEAARNALDTVKATVCASSSFVAVKAMHDCANQCLAELDRLAASGDEK